MYEKYKNIFYYYPEITKKDRVQHENNTTKALINTLALSDKFRKILTDILDFNTKLDDWNFDLQTEKCTDASVKKKDILIGLYPEDYEDKKGHTEKNEAGGTRPDAWIWNEDFRICIENKTTQSLNPKQLEGHKQLFPSPENVEVIRLTWSKLSKAFIDVQNKNIIEQQFVDYLKIIGVTPFEGFTEGDFDDLLGENNDKEYLKKRIIQLLSIIANELGFNKDFDIQNVKKNRTEYIGGNTPLKGKHEYEVVHYSIGMTVRDRQGDPGIEIYIILEDKPLSKRFVEIFSKDKDKFNELFRILKSLPFFSIVLYNRHGKLRGNYKHDLYGITEVSKLNETQLIEILNQIKTLNEIKTNDEEEYTNGTFSVKKFYAKDDVIKLGVDLKDNFIRDAKKLRELYDFLDRTLEK